VGDRMIRVVLVLYIYIYEGICTWEYLEFYFSAFIVCYIGELLCCNENFL
jgi:hypothetical protein